MFAGPASLQSRSTGTIRLPSWKSIGIRYTFRPSAARARPWTVAGLLALRLQQTKSPASHSTLRNGLNRTTQFGRRTRQLTSARSARSLLRFPEVDPIPLRIHDPGETAVFGT